MRFVLAIDTAFPAINIGVLDLETGNHWESMRETERGQAEHLVPAIGELLQTAHLDYSHLDLIVVTVGPGSFTGIRVGISTARGLGLALDKPVQGITTTDALYASWLAQGNSGPCAVAIDSHRDDVFYAAYQDEGDMPLPSVKVRIVSPQFLQTEANTLIGDAAPGTNKLRWPDAIAMARQGYNLFKTKADPTAVSATPFYAREADVTMPNQM